MSWYFYLLEFLSGVLLANGVPHFMHGISGSPFQTPFASPPGVGESSPVVNVLWGFTNLVAGSLLVHYFLPKGELAWLGWSLFGLGAMAIGLQLAAHFGKVRADKP